MPTSEEIIQKQVDAYNSRDIELFVDFYSSGATIVDGGGNPMAEGHEGMKRLYSPLFDQSPNLHCEIRKRISVGQYVIDEEIITGFNLKGYPSELRAAAIYRVTDGKITHVQLLF